MNKFFSIYYSLQIPLQMTSSTVLLQQWIHTQDHLPSDVSTLAQNQGQSFCLHLLNTGIMVIDHQPNYLIQKLERWGMKSLFHYNYIYVCGGAFQYLHWFCSVPRET